MDVLQRCFILHSRPYSETSLILDVFSEEVGRLSLVAKGARSKGSAIRGALQPFTPLFMKWSGRGQMPTLRHAEAIGLAIPLADKALYSGFYLNELLSRLLVTHLAYPSLFQHYINALVGLAQSNDPEPSLRGFEFCLLEALGYDIDFLHCAGTGEAIDPNLCYLFREQQGFIASLMKNNALIFSGAEVQAFAKRHFTTESQLKAAKRFTRLALQPYLGEKPLKSRELFIKLRKS